MKETIEKAQAPVNKAIDWVIHGAVKLAKTAGKLMKGIIDKKDKDDRLFSKGKPKKPKETREQKLERAIDHTQGTVSGLLAKGVSRPRLWATLKWLKYRWGWKQLERKPTGPDTFAIEGVINPTVKNIGTGISQMMILHSGGPVLVGSVPLPVATPQVKHVSLSSHDLSKLFMHYPAALIKPGPVQGAASTPGRLEQIARADIGRPVEIVLPGRTVERQAPGGGSIDVREHRTAGGASTLSVARLNVEMAIRKGGDVGPFVRPDLRTTLVPGIDPTTRKADPSRDSVHLYEITTMTSFVDGTEKMTKHKQDQAIWTIQRVLAAYPGAQVHYTFIAPDLPDPATQALIQKIVTGLTVADQSRFTVTWRAIGFTTPTK